MSGFLSQLLAPGFNSQQLSCLLKNLHICNQIYATAPCNKLTGNQQDSFSFVFPPSCLTRIHAVRLLAPQGLAGGQCKQADGIGLFLVSTNPGVFSYTGKLHKGRSLQRLQMVLSRSWALGGT